MKNFIKKYTFFLPLFICLFTTVVVLAQETIIDTLATVKNYQTNAETALNAQDFDTAIISFNKANDLASSTSNDMLKVDVLLGIAKLHHILQNFEKAALETTKAIALLKKQIDEDLDIEVDENRLAKAHNLYGLILTQRGDYENAETYLKEADDFYSSVDDEKNQAAVILGLGILELKKEKYKVAVNYFDAGIPLFNTHQLHYQEAFSHLNKAEALLNLNRKGRKNDLENAKISLNRVLEISTLKSYNRFIIEGYRIASQIAIQEENSEEALTNFQSYTYKKDSIFQIYQRIILKSEDPESNIRDLNEIIVAQQEELLLKQKSINFTKMTTGLSIALIVILSLLTLSFYKNNNLRIKANELLRDKNDELILAKEKAEKASLVKAQFLSTITHELRTPMYAVTGLTHLLMEENPMPHQKEHLNSLKFSGEYLLSLINNILDLNKLEANKVEVEKMSFNIKKRLNDVLIALKKSADDRKNSLHLEFDENIPEKLVGDPLKLSQILINLIGNSVKFTQNGDIHVRVQKMEQTKDKIMLHFEIEDNGVGISKKKQKSIFETFSQASLQINRKFGGTGLGLSIVRNLLELMGSKIQLESQLGKGSKFLFNIRFDVSEEFKEDKNPQNIIYDIDYVALENKRVLVVEDNKINQMITKKILEKNKMKCMVADNGTDAVSLVKENEFDVILMDIHMPGISGIEATQQIRTFNKQLPIIALTAVTIDENLDEFYRAGFNEIIPKPFKTEEFFEKIHRTLEGRKSPVDFNA